MKNLTLLIILVYMCISTFAQTNFNNNQFSINAFRNPSIGLEYQYKKISVHAGYYITNFESGVTTKFLKTGLSYWFLPVNISLDRDESNPSSFYTSASYARGLNLNYEDKNAFIGEVGFRWSMWKGLNLRLGVAGLAASGESLKVNPTPGISYSFGF